MSNLNYQASAPGKLILMGEYAVLEQAPCLVVAVDRSCHANIKPVDGNVSRIEASTDEIPHIEFTVQNGKLNFIESISDINRERLRFVIHTLEHVIEKNGGQLPSAVININSESFYHQKSGNKLGLGASAAITVSLLSALSKFIGQPISGSNLYREAFLIHRKAQGKLGSGADIAASSVGGVLEYQMAGYGAIDGTLEAISWPDNLIMIPIWAGYSASTQDLVRKVEHFQENNPDHFDSIMNPLKELSELGCETFKNGDTKGFLEVVDKFILQEMKLGEASDTEIISEAHKNILDTVKSAGGVYKPSGAGSGDIGVAFCDNTDTANKIIEALKQNNFDKLDITPQFAENEILG